MGEDKTTTDDRVVINSTSGLSLTLNGVNIAPFDVAFLIESGTGAVTLNLESSNSLKSWNNCAGIQKENDALLTIQGTGSLYTEGGHYGAGIGGGKGGNGNGNNITISGGTVTAQGGYMGAGIGGGDDGNGNNITISGGTVSAQGGYMGAGIGGGYDGCAKDNKIAPASGLRFIVLEKADYDGYEETDISDWADSELNISFAKAVARPIVTPNGGLIDHSLSVTVTCEDGAVIYYTADGTEPSLDNGTQYTGAITLTQAATLKAVAIDNGVLSGVVTAKFEMAPVQTHDLEHHDAQAATCIAIGWEEYDTCKLCDYTTYKEIAALGHDIIDDEEVPATCTQNGRQALRPLRL